MNSSTSDLSKVVAIGPPRSDRISLQRLRYSTRTGSIFGFDGFDFPPIADAIVNAAHAVLAHLVGVIEREALQRRLNAIIAFGQVLDLSAFLRHHDPSNRIARAPDFHGALHPAAP